MKLFKNFKTKKQLRAEIERLKTVQRYMEYKEIQSLSWREIFRSFKAVCVFPLNKEIFQKILSREESAR